MVTLDENVAIDAAQTIETSKPLWRALIPNLFDRQLLAREAIQWSPSAWTGRTERDHRQPVPRESTFILGLDAQWCRFKIGDDRPEAVVYFFDSSNLNRGTTAYNMVIVRCKFPDSISVTL
jgi:hypothetical protein